MNQCAPLVSIVIPVYNGANYLAQAIDSALSQTYAHCEVIVVNDGSTDGGQSEHIAQCYGPRIRYFSQTNGGVASALNRAMLEMRGSFFSWLSHDDVYLPGKIERQMTLLGGNTQLAIYSDYRLFSDDGSFADIHLPDSAPEEFRYRLALEGGVNGCTLLIPVHALREVGGFDEKLRTTQDYDMWFRLAKQLRFVHLPEVLVAARVHPHQGIYTQSEQALRECQNLHAGFARELRDTELPGVGELNQQKSNQGDSKGLDEMPSTLSSEAGHWYTVLANSFWQRGFYEAARIAESRASLHGVGNFTLRRGRWRATSQRMITQRLLRPLLNPTQRARIRQWLQRRQQPEH